MPLKVQPGSPIRFEIRTQSPDTLAPIPRLPVFLDRFEPDSNVPVPVEGAETDAEGRAVVSTTMPDVPGSYRFRSRTTGIDGEYRADTSPSITVQVVG